jgi:hypothetical protein
VAWYQDIITKLVEQMEEARKVCIFLDWISRKILEVVKQTGL